MKLEKPFRLNSFLIAKLFIHTRKNNLAMGKLFNLDGFSNFVLFQII